jgi:hypothetical protein
MRPSVGRSHWPTLGCGRVVAVRWSISHAVEHILSDLESSNPEIFDVVTEDLHLLQLVDIELLDSPAELATFQYLIGPTGRVRYWVGVVASDLILIEDLQVD